MREIALATQAKNKEIINNINVEIKARLDFCNIILTNYCDKNFCYLLLAIDDNIYLTCESIIKDLIIDYIEDVYKVEYLKSKIKYPIANTLAFNAYIKVLSVFDRTADEVAIKKSILLNQTFFIDSFLSFRLGPLKAHWDNLAELSSDNLTLCNSSTFLDVIRFLINTMDNNVYKVKIVCNDNRYVIYKMKTKNDKIKKISDCNDSLELITNIFNNCPNYIDVYLDNNENVDAVTFLSDIYAGRLKIYQKN